MTFDRSRPPLPVAWWVAPAIATSGSTMMASLRRLTRSFLLPRIIYEAWLQSRQERLEYQGARLVVRAGRGSKLANRHRSPRQPQGLWRGPVSGVDRGS